MTTSHDDRKGYYFNYLTDASHLYWAARLLELNYRSLDPNDKMIDKLLVLRLRKLADSLVDQSINGLKNNAISLAEKEELANKLAEEHSK